MLTQLILITALAGPSQVGLSPADAEEVPAYASEAVSPESTYLSFRPALRAPIPGPWRYLGLRWNSPGNLTPHVGYYPAAGGYFYLRPYHHHHVRQQQALVSQWDGNPKHPYANRIFDRFYEQWQKEKGEEREKRKVVDPPPPLPPPAGNEANGKEPGKPKESIPKPSGVPGPPPGNKPQRKKPKQGTESEQHLSRNRHLRDPRRIRLTNSATALPERRRTQFVAQRPDRVRSLVPPTPIEKHSRAVHETPREFHREKTAPSDGSEPTYLSRETNRRLERRPEADAREEEVEEKPHVWWPRENPLRR